MLIAIVITLHFIFDWILQPRHIAKCKKDIPDCLFTHMIINILPFSLIVLFLLIFEFGYDSGVASHIIVINAISHFIIDWCLPKGKTEREMINWTAVDQILHINILILLLEIFK